MDTDWTVASSVSLWPSTHGRVVAAAARGLVQGIAAVGGEAEHVPALATDVPARVRTGADRVRILVSVPRQRTMIVTTADRDRKKETVHLETSPAIVQGQATEIETGHDQRIETPPPTGSAMIGHTLEKRQGIGMTHRPPVTRTGIIDLGTAMMNHGKEIGTIPEKEAGHPLIDRDSGIRRSVMVTLATMTTKTIADLLRALVTTETIEIREEVQSIRIYYILMTTKK